MTGGHTMFRPPAEAGSVLIRVADGCPHNSCAFCAMYRGVPYQAHDRDTVASRIDLAAARDPDARRKAVEAGYDIHHSAEILQEFYLRRYAEVTR